MEEEEGRHVNELTHSADKDADSMLHGSRRKKFLESTLNSWGRRLGKRDYDPIVCSVGPGIL